jgi:hypothetical protein
MSRRSAVSFWLVHTIVQATILVVVRETWWMLAALFAFPVYFVVKRAALRAARANVPDRPSRLLLLRVFKDDQYVERLFDTLSDKWAFFGRVEMIGGSDLALRNISPSDFIEFVSRTLKRRFIHRPEELERRLVELESASAAPNGRFRFEHFFCHEDTWQPVMHALSARTDAALMDLHAFGASRRGSIHELLHLAVNEPSKPVLLLYGDNDELDQMKALFTDAQTRPGADWFTAKADRDRPLEADPLLKALFQVTVSGAE